MSTVGSGTVWFLRTCSGKLVTSLLSDISGPDVDDCGKNGKKAAEAMSLNKDGKSELLLLP